MILFKLIFFALIFFLLLGLFSMLTMFGVIRDLFFGRNTPKRHDSRTQFRNSEQQQQRSNQPQQQNKIFQKDEGEYVDFTEV